jgi:hypothetical protein
MLASLLMLMCKNRLILREKSTLVCWCCNAVLTTTEADTENGEAENDEAGR